MNARRTKFGASLTRPRVLLALLLILAAAVPSPAQKPQPSLLAISVSPAQVNFVLLANGISNGSSPVTITTTWLIQQGGTDVSVYAYFVSPSAALSSGSSVIPSSKVRGRIPGGTFTPFTGAGPFSPGGSLLIFSQQVRGAKKVTRTDTLDLQIDTTGLNLRPGNYSGALRIQATAL